jgi:hypothetical protein
VLRFAATVFLPGRKGNFLAEALRESYDAYALGKGLPVTIKPKAFAGVMRVLRNKGLVEKGSPEHRRNFVLATTYRSLI